MALNGDPDATEDEQPTDAVGKPTTDEQPAAAVPQIASSLPNALERLEALVSTCRHPAFFLDYDGTLAPIVSNPELAIISSECREALRALADAYPVSIVSGRSVDKLRNFLRVDVVLAGSHGLDIQGTQLQGHDRQSSAAARSAGDSAAAAAEPEPPAAAAAAGNGEEGRLLHPVAAAGRSLLSHALALLDEALGGTIGYETEDNEFCLSVHYRRVPAHLHETVHTAVLQVVAEVDGLMLRNGKMVFELRPDVPWDKGRAVEYLLSRLHAPPPVAQSGTTHGAAAQGSSSAIPAAERGQSRLCPFYLGDDVADEDALGFVESVGGIGIKVTDSSAADVTTTLASHRLDGPHQVLAFISRFVKVADTAAGAADGVDH